MIKLLDALANLHRKVLKLMLNAGAVILAIAGLLLIVSGSELDLFTIAVFAMTWIWTLILVARSITKGRCPSCKRLYALKYVGSKVTDKESISVRKEVNRWNQYGEIIDTQEQYIPGTRYTYRDAYKCKYCGHVKYRQVVESHENV